MIVVGCGKAKLDRSAPAEDLYTGSLFRAARRYAEASGEPWAILSGAHGIILPHVILRPYDAGPPEHALGSWGWKAAIQIDERLALYQHRRAVEILAGERYAAPLADALLKFDLVATLPLRGLGVGQRLRRLKEMAESLRSARSVEAAEGKER